MADPIKQAERTARAADHASAGFATALSRILKDMERQMQSLLTTSPLQATALREEIRRLLKAAGYEQLAFEATSEPLDAIGLWVLAGRTLDLGQRMRLEAMKGIHYLDLLEEGDVTTTQLWRAAVRGTFSTEPVQDIVRDVANVLDTSEKRIRTLYDTAVSIYGRQVEAEAAGDDPDTPFMYAGPVDEKTRDFCMELVGKVFTRAEIDDMDNGQIANVFLTGGGYNCRHVWQEVSRFSQAADLVGTGKRFPEVQEDVDMVEANQ